MNERVRYRRQMLLPQIGDAGQERLASASILVVGAGGLGSASLLYLAAAGIGRLGIVEPDRVDLSNLHRQTIYASADAGKLKAEAAVKRLRLLNPDIVVEAYPVTLAPGNAPDLIAAYDLVVDGVDNVEARQAMNAAAVAGRKDFVHGAVFQAEGRVTVLAPHRGGPCYRCLEPAASLAPAAASPAVLGMMAGLVGLWQATEAVKLILGAGDPLIGRMLIWDAWAGRGRELHLARDPSCPVCGTAEGR